MHVTVYTKPGCHLCDEALLLVDKLTPKYAIELTEVNIIEDMAVYEQYKHIIPIIEVTNVQVGRISAPITEPDLRAYFDRARAASSNSSALLERETVLDRLAKWVGKR